jgi:hypothetical protein
MEKTSLLDSFMKITIRKIVKKPLRRIEFVVKGQISRIVRWVFLKLQAPIYVTFNSTMSVDGTGAQLQRQASVIALAKYFGFHYIHSDIKQVSVHPLDPFQSKSEYLEYLIRLNQFLKVNPTTGVDSSIREAIVPSFSFAFLIRECLSQAIRPKKRFFSIYEPYAVSEFCPAIMDGLHLESNENSKKISSGKVFTIVIHYRQGVGGFALYPGQNIPREIPIEVFVVRVASIVNELPEHLDWQIVVLTDAPESETTFTPPVDQIKLWEGTPGFSNGLMTIRPTRFDALESYSKFPLKVMRGGNPLDAILLMASADVLLAGKSSLSYLGGLMNQGGQVYYPKDFWHRPLQDWRVL